MVAVVLAGAFPAPPRRFPPRGGSVSPSQPASQPAASRLNCQFLRHFTASTLPDTRLSLNAFARRLPGPGRSATVPLAPSISAARYRHTRSHFAASDCPDVSLDRPPFLAQTCLEAPDHRPTHLVGSVGSADLGGLQAQARQSRRYRRLCRLGRQAGKQAQESTTL